MQILIDINDNEYLGIKNYPDNITSYPVTIHLYEAVRNGTPIPKGTGGLIAKSEILNFLKCPEYDTCDWKNCSDCNRSRCINFSNVNKLAPIVESDKESYDSDAWCNTCESKYLETDCLGCAKYDKYNNLVALTHYKKESEGKV